MSTKFLRTAIVLAILAGADGLLYSTADGASSAMSSSELGSDHAASQQTGPNLMQLDREFAARAAADGVDGWVATFAENGAMLVGSGDWVSGHDAIRELMGPFFESVELRWEPDRSGFHIDGELGFTDGSYQRQYTDEDGRAMVQSGRYTTVWQRQPDGSWKVLFDTGSDVGEPVPAN